MPNPRIQTRRKYDICKSIWRRYKQPYYRLKPHFALAHAEACSFSDAGHAAPSGRAKIRTPSPRLCGGRARVGGAKPSPFGTLALVRERPGPPQSRGGESFLASREEFDRISMKRGTPPIPPGLAGVLASLRPPRHRPTRPRSGRSYHRLNPLFHWLPEVQVPQRRQFASVVVGVVFVR